MVPIITAMGAVSAGRVALVCELPLGKNSTFKAITANKRVEELDVFNRFCLVEIGGELVAGEIVFEVDYLLMLDARIVIFDNESWAFLSEVPNCNGREGTQ